MSKPKLFVGADPDTKRPAFAGVHEDGSLAFVWVPKLKDHTEIAQLAYKVPKGLQERLSKYDIFRAAIEDQYIVDGKKANSLRKLCQSAGACMAVLPALSNTDKCSARFIRPSNWNGGFEKHVHQARTCRRMGWEYDIKGGKSGKYAVPRDVPLVTLAATEWKHAVDAVALACYALDMHNKEQRTGIPIWHKM